MNLRNSLKRLSEKMIHDEDGKISLQPVPRNYHEAMKSPKAQDWKEAMEAELRAHDENGDYPELGK